MKMKTKIKTKTKVNKVEGSNNANRIRVASTHGRPHVQRCIVIAASHCCVISRYDIGITSADRTVAADVLVVVAATW